MVGSRTCRRTRRSSISALPLLDSSLVQKRQDPPRRGGATDLAVAKSDTGRSNCLERRVCQFRYQDLSSQAVLTHCSGNWSCALSPTVQRTSLHRRQLTESGCETLIERLKAKREEERDLFKKRYEQLDAECRAIDQVLDALQQELKLCVYGSTDLTTPNAIDLSGCETLIERLKRIAVAKGGELYIPAARDILLAEGASSADPNNLRSSILKTLKRNPEDWEFVGNRTYRYRPCDEKGDEGPRAEDEQPHGVWYNSSNDDGATECYDHSEAPGPPERRCPQWPTHSLDYDQSLINQQDPSDLADDDSPSSRRLSGSLPELAQDATREPISGEANMNVLRQLPPWQGPHNADATRVARAQRIAKSTPIVETEYGWTIPSERRPGVHYRIWVDEDGAHCDCPDTLRTCKHILALQVCSLTENPKAKAVPSRWRPAPVEPTVDTPPPPSQPNGSTPMPADPAGLCRNHSPHWQVLYQRPRPTRAGCSRICSRLFVRWCRKMSARARGRPSAADPRPAVSGRSCASIPGCPPAGVHTAHPGQPQRTGTHLQCRTDPQRRHEFPEQAGDHRPAPRPHHRVSPAFPRKLSARLRPTARASAPAPTDRWRDDKKHGPEKTRHPPT